ncbi:MAG: BtrH N-terminal domain-containing protein, partial [Spirochaetaceae bacterium]|nr:BtrH N-terminal domain-containing protein [Spirochaetaceae bacterium]
MRKAIGFLAAALPALLSACASAPESAAPALSADASRIASGGHCESSAMLNALLAAGYDFAEAEIVGYGAAPSFVYVPGSFPFIGTRSATMREDFFKTAGIAWEKRAPSPGQDAWAEIYETLGRGIPVMLRVDMRYLPYRYGGKYGPAYMSFGWHWVTLFKVDRRLGLAWVTDTEYEGLQEIRIKDLDKARASRTKVWPPNREFAWVEPAVEKRTFDRAKMVRAAATAAASNLSGRAFESLPAGLPELERFPSIVRAFDRELPS